jgi:hypothetical protein
LSCGVLRAPTKKKQQHQFELLKTMATRAPAETHQIPLQIPTHLSLHLIHLLQTKHLLSHNTPTLITVRIIANDLASDHKRRYEQPMPARPARGREAGLEPAQEEERDEGHKVGETGAVERVGDEVR